jgi:hypothetical protein
MFVGKALPANIRLRSKDLLGTSTVAYYRNPYITTIKSFIEQGTRTMKNLAKMMKPLL